MMYMYIILLCVTHKDWTVEDKFAPVIVYLVHNFPYAHEWHGLIAARGIKDPDSKHYGFL